MPRSVTIAAAALVLALSAAPAQATTPTVDDARVGSFAGDAYINEMRVVLSRPRADGIIAVLIG
jgi:hypothetical protein